MTLAQAYENLTSKGFIKPQNPTPMPNPVPPTWNLNEYCHFHQNFGHKTENCFYLKDEVQDLIDSGTLPNLNIIIKPNISKNPLSGLSSSSSFVSKLVAGRIDSKLIKIVEVNAVEVQGIWDEKDEILKSLVVVWGIILPKGKSKLKECQALYNRK